MQIFNISWLNKNEIKDFFYYLANKNNYDLIYENPLIYALLAEQDYTKTIWWVFAIYVAKITSISIFYFYVFEREDQHWYFWILRALIFIFVAHDFI